MEQSVSQIAAIAVAYSSTEPSNKEVLWFDTSIVTDNPFEAIKVYDKQNLQWKLVNRTPEQILIDLRTVDGEGSGLDADTLQGYTPEDLISSGGGVPMLNTGELLVGQADGTGTAQTVGGIATIQPDGTLVQSPSAIDHTLLSNIGTNSHAQIDTHIADTANPHGVTAAQVGNTTAQWNANQLDGNTLNIGTPGAPEDGYTITWDNTAGEFILSAGGGGNTIYTADDTVGSGRVLTLTDNVTFSGGVTIHEGADTLSSSSHTKMYDGDTTPNLLWDWRNNGDVHFGTSGSPISPTIEVNGSVTYNFPSTSAGQFIIDGSNQTSSDSILFEVKSPGPSNSFNIDQKGEIQSIKITGTKILNIRNSADTVGIDLNTTASLIHSSVLLTKGANSYTNGIRQTFTSTTEEMKWQQASSVDFNHQIKSGTTSGTNEVRFFNKGWTNSDGFVVGSTAVLSGEDISLQGDVMVGGSGDLLGFYGTTPTAQATTGITAATFVANTSGIADDTATFDGYTIGQAIAALRANGLLA